MKKYQRSILFQAEPSVAENIKAGAKAIQEGGQDLLSLIDDILDLVRINSASFKLELESVTIKEIILECKNTALNTNANNVTFNLPENPCGDIDVYADKVRLKQVIFNFFSNAIKYN